MRTLNHLRLAGRKSAFAAASEPPSEICLIDYTHCPERDTCFVLDLGSGCEAHDGCIIDTD